MTFESFTDTLKENNPPADLSAYLQVLWYDAKANWERAHNIAQDIDDNTGSLLHAYLHRKEGDHSNAAYWYRKAGRPMPAASLNEEWQLLVRELLKTG